MSARCAIGIGCTSAATPEEIIELLAAVFGPVRPSIILATLDRRAAIAAAVAKTLHAELVLFNAEQLAHVRGIATPSARAAALLGTWSVAEASALAAAGEGARLVVPRRAGRRCTCALAEVL